MAAGELVDGVGEVGFGVEAVELGGLDQGVKDGGALAACIGADKQEVLAADRDAAQQPLIQRAYPKAAQFRASSLTLDDAVSPYRPARDRRLAPAHCQSRRCHLNLGVRVDAHHEGHHAAHPASELLHGRLLAAHLRLKHPPAQVKGVAQPR